MDLSKIFLKDACPTAIGGQAVMEGVMMRGSDRMATALRLPDGRIHIKTQALPKSGGWMKVPILRGVIAFIVSLVTGMKTLIYSADALEFYAPEEGQPKEEPGAITKWVEKHFGERAAWNFAIYAAVLVAIILAVGIFILLPTVAVNLLASKIKSKILLNLCEGILRLLIFIIYIAAIGRMKEIRTTFEYHGAEHKTIHCFENNLELTPENAQEFYTLHPRCGTSFLMFVMLISLVLFSLLGWPNIWGRLLSRILLLPVVAGISYELLKWAGRSDNAVVKVLSMPGLLLQKLTTREPSNEELEIAIVSMKAVLVDADTPYIEGICDKDANLIEEIHIGEAETTYEKSDTIDMTAADDVIEGEIEEEYAMADRPNLESKQEKDKKTGFFDKILGRGRDEEEYQEEVGVQNEDRGFMSFFSKQREEVGVAPSGRAKNAAGIPVWDEEEEIQKAKEE